MLFASVMQHGIEVWGGTGNSDSIFYSKRNI